MTLTHTNRCSGSLLMPVNRHSAVWDPFSASMGLRPQAPSLHFFAPICISFPSGGAPLQLRVAPFLVQLSERGRPFNKVAVCLLSPRVFRASFWPRGLLCPSLCHLGLSYPARVRLGLSFLKWGSSSGAEKREDCAER